MDNRILTINDQFVEIDESTAIGITLQSYDVKNPAVPFCNVSNEFSIPKTKKNISLLGFADDRQSVFPTHTNRMYINYSIANDRYIDNGKCTLKYIDNNRIGLSVANKSDIWDRLRGLKWQDMTIQLLDWLKTYKGVPSYVNPISFNSIVNYLCEANNPLKCFAIYYSDTLLNSNQIFADHQTSYGFVNINVKVLFEFLQYYFDFDFGVFDSTLQYNIFSDTVVNNLFIPIRDFFPKVISSDDRRYYIESVNRLRSINVLDTQINNFGNAVDKQDKTMFDFVLFFLQYFNCIKDEVDGGVRFFRFDDLEYSTNIIDFSKKYAGKYKYTPANDKLFQNNYVKFKNIFEGGGEYSAAKKIVCINQNITVNGNIVEIDGYVPGIYTISSPLLIFSKPECLKSFTFLVFSGSAFYCDVIIKSQTFEESTPYHLNTAVIYDINSEYRYLEKILANPAFYDVEMWIDPVDIHNFSFFAKYYIPELRGTYFINRISGWNPQKSNDPVKVELTYLSSELPNKVYPKLTDVVGNYFVDGNNNKFI